jgi:glycosyltransferase 2 family protein
VNKYLHYIIIISVSSISLYFAFSGEDIDLIYSELKKIKLFGVILASLTLLISCLIRAYRWKLLIDPLEKLTLRHVVSATMIGYFGNGVLAFRLGEILKAYSVSKNTNLKISQAIGTVILERVLDLIMVFIICLILVPWIPTQFSEVKITLFTLFVVVIIFILVAIAFNKIKPNFIKKYFKYFSSIDNKIFVQLKNIYVGLRVIINNNRLKSILFSSLILWSTYFIITLMVLNSCSINLKPIDAGILFVLGSLALGIPALPGSIGTYDVAIKYILIAIFSVKNHEALNYALISHAVSYFPLTIVGAIYFIFGNVKFKNLNKR